MGCVTYAKLATLNTIAVKDSEGELIQMACKSKGKKKKGKRK